MKKLMVLVVAVMALAGCQDRVLWDSNGAYDNAGNTEVWNTNGQVNSSSNRTIWRDASGKDVIK